MDIQALLVMVASKYPVVALVLGGLGALVIIGMAVVALTPSKDDDAKLEALMAKPVIGPILKALMAFSPIAKK